MKRVPLWIRQRQGRLSAKSLVSHPLSALGVAVVVALIVTSLNVSMFWRSDIRRTVQLLQSNFDQQRRLTISGSQQPTDALSRAETSIQKVLNETNDESDFSADPLSDEALGL